jgi:hypothetical protein
VDDDFELYRWSRDRTGPVGRYDPVCLASHQLEPLILISPLRRMRLSFLPWAANRLRPSTAFFVLAAPHTCASLVALL